MSMKSTTHDEEHVVPVNEECNVRIIRGIKFSKRAFALLRKRGLGGTSFRVFQDPSFDEAERESLASIFHLLSSFLEVSQFSPKL